MKKWILKICCMMFFVSGCSRQEGNQEISQSTQVSSSKQTPITLTIGDIVLDAYLNDSLPAQSLLEQLPLTVTLNDSDNDFCGDKIQVEYEQSDITTGYENGDLVFWPGADNFVIFVDDEENSASTGNLVKLGKVTSSQEMLDTLQGQIEVTIARKEEIMKQIKITVGQEELYATLEDNATTAALLEQMPLTLLMEDLYGREMCYRFGADTLPYEETRSDGYEIGDIAYWPPRGSFVILYEQNGEQFERVHLGHIDEGVEVFKTTGSTEVTFEVVNENS